MNKLKAMECHETSMNHPMEMLCFFLMNENFVFLSYERRCFENNNEILYLFH